MNSSSADHHWRLCIEGPNMFAKGVVNLRKGLLVCLAILMQAWFAAPAHAQAAPTITSVTPNISPSTGGTTIVITGTNFVGVSRVYFAGQVNVDVRSYTVDSATQITAVTEGTGFTGLGNIAVDTPNGTGIRPFEVLPPFSVSQVTPATGTYSGGEQVTISGQGFRRADGSSAIASVRFGGVTASLTGFNNGTQFSVTTPAVPGNSAGPVNVEVTTVAGEVAVINNGFTYYGPPPTISTVTPSSGPTGGGTTVVITGTNFNNVTAVDFANPSNFISNPAASFTVNSPTQITAVTPNVGGGVSFNAVVTVRTTGGVADKFNAFTFVPTPTISSVSPSSGDTAGGTSVTIFGSNFVAGATVTFGGVSATSVTVNGSTNITAIAPARAAGTVDVVVTTPGGTATRASAFTYAQLPTITSISPTSGSTNGGTLVTVTGTNFTNVTNVRFGMFGTSSVPYTVVSSTQITFTTPQSFSGPGTATLEIITAAGTATAPSVFTYTSPPPVPTISFVSGNSGIEAGGTRVNINGNNLNGASSVTFGGVPALAFSVANANSITAYSPPGSGTVPIVVTTPNGSATAATQFTYTSGRAPTIQGLSNTTPPTTGANIGVYGTNIVDATSVTVGGTAAAFIVAPSGTGYRLEVTVPPGTANTTVPLVVTTPSGSASTNLTYQTASPSAPTLTSVNPSSVPSAGNVYVTISGTNLATATGVSFGGAASTAIFSQGPGSVVAKAPAGAVGSVDVSVTTPAGTATLQNALTYSSAPPPVVTAVTPNFGPRSGGTSVVIRGSGFTGATSVTAFGQSQTFTVDSDTQISLTTSQVSQGGSTSIVITTPGGQTFAPFTFSVAGFPAPTLTSISSTSGSTAGGTLVTVVGTNFTAGTTVSFGDAPAAQIVVNSSTQLTAISPAAAAGTVDVKVTTAGGIATLSNAYTYASVATPAPTITAVAPNSGPVAGGTSVVITGTNLTGATAVGFGSTAATSFTVDSATQITAIAPAGSAGSVNVSVTTAGGSATSNGAFTYVAAPQAAPTITTIAPASGTTAGGTSVVITGTGFTGASAVTFGGTAATSFTVNSATQITAVAPAGSAGAVDVSVTTASGTATLNGGFTYDAAPVITAQGGTSGATTAALSVNENQTSVIRLTANETVTWSITGGADQAKFQIAADGTLTFAAAPNFEAPSDADANNSYVVEITATDSGSNASTLAITVTVRDIDDTAPVISGPSGGAGAAASAQSINEGQTAVATFTASETATWSLDGGSDASAFRIDQTTGVLVFASAPDYESPTDSDRNNTYVVRVKAADAAGNAGYQTLTVTISNVDELGRRLAQAEGQLRTGLRSHVAHSLSDMLSFNESLMKAANDDDCTNPSNKSLSGKANANQDGGKVNMAQRLSECGRRHQAYIDFGLNYSKQGDNWTTRMFAALRLETKVDSNLTLGASLMASQASDTLTGFTNSSISDETLQLSLYGRYAISSKLRTGAFAGYGQGWYDFGLAESDGFALDGTMTGKRQVYGWMLSGDFNIGDTVVTTDAIVSHAREKLGSATLAARYQGESRSGIALAVGSVDTTRISVPVTAPIQLTGNDDLGQSARLLLSPGLLCEDNDVQLSSLRCGYQLGAKLVANDGGRNRFFADYRWESVAGMRRSLIGLGYAYRFGDKGLELALEANRGITGMSGQDNRALLSLRLTQ